MSHKIPCDAVMTQQLILLRNQPQLRNEIAGTGKQMLRNYLYQLSLIPPSTLLLISLLQQTHTLSPV